MILMEKMNNRNIQVAVLVGSILLLAACLRAPIVSLGPVVHIVGDDLAVSNAFMGIVTTLPVLCFALGSPIAATLAHRFEIRHILTVASWLLAVGISVRSLWHTPVGLLAGTVLLSVAISMANVLLPSMVKMNFPLRMGMMTGLLSASMSIAAGLSAGLSVPVAQQSGWQWSLGMWAILAAITGIVWLGLQHLGRMTSATISTNQNKAHLLSATPMLRSRLAWSVSLFMGMQSFSYYTLASWLPTILIDKHISATAAGWYSSLLQWVGLPVVLLASALVEKIRYQQRLTLAVTSCSVLGVLGIWLLPEQWVWLNVVLLGIGVSGSFSLCLMFFGMRTRNSIDAARLSAMSQTVGYLLAVSGPLGAGILYDHFHSWQPILILMTILMLIKSACGFYSAQPIVLGKEIQSNMESSS